MVKSLTNWNVAINIVSKMKKNSPIFECLRNWQTANPLSTKHFPADCWPHLHNFPHKKADRIFFNTKKKTFDYCKNDRNSGGIQVLKMTRKHRRMTAVRKNNQLSPANCKRDWIEFCWSTAISDSWSVLWIVTDAHREMAPLIDNLSKTLFSNEINIS